MKQLSYDVILPLSEILRRMASAWRGIEPARMNECPASLSLSLIMMMIKKTKNRVSAEIADIAPILYVFIRFQSAWSFDSSKEI